MNNTTVGQLSGLAGRLVAEGLITAEAAVDAQKEAGSEHIPFEQYLVEKENVNSHHLAEVTTLAKGLVLPEFKAWEFDWPDAEPPETASYEALHYRMSLRQAISLALKNERAAENYYRGMADNAGDKETARIAGQFADEELSHAAQLEKLLRELPENGAYIREEDDDPHMPE